MGIKRSLDDMEGGGVEKTGNGRLPKHLAKKLKKQKSREAKTKNGEGREVKENDEQGKLQGKESSKGDESLEYPYTVDDDDHCESPLQAYEDIAPILDAIKESLGYDHRSQLRIYDPYFCEGVMKGHLASLGFTDVYNELEDFYARVASKTCPEYDVLITNPPYSGDHPSKLMDFVVASGKPFFLLMPNWVYTKEYYAPALKGKAAFYVSPMARYMYTTPKGRRQKKSGKLTSPFPTLWYCSTNTSSMPSNQVCRKLDKAKVHVCQHSSELPLSVAHESDPRKKKERNKLKRKKNKKKNNKTKSGDEHI
jgi:hypothetical protein